MDTRKITYASTTSAAADPKTVFSAAETWGDLKKEDADIGAKAHGMRACIREGNITLTSDSQKLPTGDFTLYFLVEKNNSGI